MCEFKASIVMGLSDQLKIDLRHFDSWKSSPRRVQEKEEEDDDDDELERMEYSKVSERGFCIDNMESS